MIRLSQRNLLTLLHGLEARGETHLCKPDVGLVVAETDDRHYQGRVYGRMSLPTETFIVGARQALRRVELQVYCDQNPPEWALTAARVIAGDFTNSAEVVGIAHVISKYAREAGAW